MTATIYYDTDADLSLLKNKTIAIIGYGSQGHAQAQNLRDSGLNVVIGQRPGGPNYDLAKEHGFEPVSAAEATKQGDLVNILLPDEIQAGVYEQEIRDNLSPGNILMCSHGFNIHFKFIVPPEGVDVGRPPAATNPLANHAAFEIEDHDAACEALRARGVELIDTGAERGQIFLRDPDGNVIELIRPGGRLGRTR